MIHLDEPVSSLGLAYRAWRRSFLQEYEWVKSSYTPEKATPAWMMNPSKLNHWNILHNLREHGAVRIYSPQQLLLLLESPAEFGRFQGLPETCVFCVLLRLPEFHFFFQEIILQFRSKSYKIKVLEHSFPQSLLLMLDKTCPMSRSISPSKDKWEERREADWFEKDRCVYFSVFAFLWRIWNFIRIPFEKHKTRWWLEAALGERWGKWKKEKTYVVLFMMTAEMEICPSEKG